MRLIDAYILARTKRKTRRIRTALVTIVSSLMFAVLFLVVLVVSGVVNSSQQLKDVGFNSRHLTAIMRLSAGFGSDYQALVNKVEAEMDAELRTRKIAITQDTHNDPSYQAERERRLTVSLTEAANKDLQILEQDVKKLGQLSALHHLSRLGAEDSLTYHPTATEDPKVKELVAQQNKQSTTETTNPFVNQKLEFYDIEADMLRTQVQPGQSLSWQPGQPIPAVLPYSHLQVLANRSLTNLDTTAKNQAYKELITTHSGKVLDYCWRNPTALQQLQDVIKYNYDAANDKDKTTNPIAVPNCGGFDQAQLKKIGLVTTLSDEAAPKPLFKAPEMPPPVTTKIQFKIVGFVPTHDNFGNGDIIESLFINASLIPFTQNPILLPKEVTAKHPQFIERAKNLEGQTTSLIADFASREQQKAFLAHACQGDECMQLSKPFMIPFGNLAVALEETIQFLTLFLTIATVVMMIIAAIMILFTISKVIADSTKEIAVFRALGARRRDIAQIYFTYGSMLTISALACSIIFAIAGAYSIHILQGEQFAALLVQASGAYTANLQANLVGYEPFWLAAIAAALAASALVGISIPIAAAIKRRLINTLREE